MERRALRRIVRGLAATLLVVGALGCAQRTDWIQGTLVTVDVSGLWRGRLTVATGTGGLGGIGGEMELTLTQHGLKVTGEGRIRADRVRIEGTVRGDVFSFSELGGRLHAQATVAGDEMSGGGRQNITYPLTFGAFSFKLSR
jgi:hypothetical protein